MVRKGLILISDDERRTLIEETLHLLLQDFGEDLIGVVVFGSVARGKETPESDVDLLVVSGSFSESLSDRMDQLVKILMQLESTEQHGKMRRKGINTWIQFHPLNPDEARLYRPIYLDIVEDGIIIYDRDEFMETILTNLKRKLEELGARRIFLRDGSWYWDLKPDVQQGEVVEV